MDSLPPLPFRRTSKAIRRSYRPAVEVLEGRQLLTRNVISGFVYHDVNSNGLRDPGEPPIANTYIELRDANFLPVGAALTDASGFYRFDRNVRIDTSPRVAERSIAFSRSVNGAQTKTLPQFDPALGALTGVDVYFDGAITSRIKVENFNVDESSDLVGRVSGNLGLAGPGLGNFQFNPTVIAGEFAATPYDGARDYAGGSGIDFGDKTATGSGVRTIADAATLASYTGTSMVSFTLNSLVTSNVQGNGDEDASIRSTVNANVRVVYHYIPDDCLQPGPYTIHEKQPEPFLDGRESQNGVVVPPTNPNDTLRVTLTDVDSTNNNFGELLAVVPASICGFVYVDNNDNGLREAGEAPIPGTTVQLHGVLDQGGPVTMTMTTAADGSYCFTNLQPGVYRVVEVQPAGYDDGKDAVGSVGGVLGNDVLFNVPLEAGVNGVEYNFGEKLTRQILTSRGQIRPLDFNPVPNVPVLSKRQLNGDLPFIEQVASSSSFVDGLYRRFLNRAADPSGLMHWVSQLVSGRARIEVVTEIWNSREHRQQQVRELYQQILDRDAGPTEQGIWAERFLAGATQEQVSAEILASGEFQARFGPSDFDYVTALYARVLHRQADDAGRSNWVAAVASRGRQAVALGFLQSGEHFASYVEDRAREYLKRAPAAFEVQSWTSQLVAGRENLDSHAIRVLASNEVADRALRAVRENRTT